MFTPDIFSIIGILLGLISIRNLIYVIRHRKKLFDDHFTASERQRLSEAAFFILMPVSVLLHEAGHAVAVLWFGGEIVDFGWYFFYGFVGHQGFYVPSDIFWIALSGNLVSVVLGVVAIGVPLLRPFRPAVNYLLFVFGAISILNSLVFYPALDFAGGFVGDWSQIYSRDTMGLSIGMGVFHAVFLLGCVIVWRSDRARRLYAVRTGLSPEAMRRVSRSDAARELLEIGEGLATSWKHPLRLVTDASNAADGITLQWVSNGYGRIVAAYSVVDGPRRLEVHGAIQPLDGSLARYGQPIARVDGSPPPQQIQELLTQVLDLVDGWSTQSVPQMTGTGD